MWAAVARRCPTAHHTCSGDTSPTTATFDVDSSMKKVISLNCRTVLNPTNFLLAFKAQYACSF